jgi:hypothetical protein
MANGFCFLSETPKPNSVAQLTQNPADIFNSFFLLRFIFPHSPPALNAIEDRPLVSLFCCIQTASGSDKILT